MCTRLREKSVSMNPALLKGSQVFDWIRFTQFSSSPSVFGGGIAEISGLESLTSVLPSSHSNTGSHCKPKAVLLKRLV